MSNTQVKGFPNAPQSQYARISKAPLAGSLFNEELWNARPLSAVLPHVEEVAFSLELTIANNTPTDEVGISIEGGEVVVPSGADATASALALANKILAAGFAVTFVADAVAAVAVVTVTGVLGQDPTILGVEKGATTIALVYNPVATTQPIACFGEGVVRYDDSTSINVHKFKRPSSMTDKFLGVLLRTTGAQIPTGQLSEYNPSLDPDNAMPGNTYSVERADVGVMVDYVGTPPTPLDDVYHIMVGPDAGQWSATSGAVSKVVTLTATSVADGNIGFDYDGLTALSVTATASIINDTASLFALLTADADYRALFADYTTDAVDNLDGTMTLTFAEGLDPVFTDASTGTSAMVEAVDTAFVAANAVPRPEYSWNRASIIASADRPARAYLLLSPS